MKRFNLFSLLLTCALACLCPISFAQTPPGNDQAASASAQLPSKDKFLIVVLAGQSNMAGRGKVADFDKTPVPRVFMLTREGQWVPAVEPVHYDKSVAGVGPGREFARLLAESNPQIAVGLVPTACGGSPIDSWTPGAYWGQTKSHPYDDALARVRRAQEDGVLAAILWRQGEADCSPEKGAVHLEKLKALFERFRQDFNSPEVPILVGELYQYPNPSVGANLVRQAHIDVTKELPRVAFVSAEGATLNPDNVHFDRDSQIEQGRRFFQAYQELVAEQPKE